MFNKGMYFFILCCFGVNGIQAMEIDEGQPRISQQCALCKSSFEKALKDLEQDTGFDQFFQKAKQYISKAKNLDMNKDTEDRLEIAGMEDRLDVIQLAFDYSKLKALTEDNENESAKNELKSMEKELTDTLGWYGEDIDAIIRNVLPSQQEFSLND